MSPESKAILEKLGDDEPIFILRAQDSFATGLIASWITRAQAEQINEEKTAAARKHLIAFFEWQFRHPQKVKLPD